MYIDLIINRRAKELKKNILLQKARAISKNFQTGDMEIRYNCAKRYHVLYINCSKGIIFGLVPVHHVIIFLLICLLLSSITR